MASQAQSEMNMENAKAALTWLISFKALARAKDWKDIDDKRLITDNFIASCGLTALTKIIAIVQPNDIEKMKFDDVETAIKAYFGPDKKLKIAERTKFYSQKQKQTETITEFVARLRAQAQHCEFENLKACDSPQEQMIIMGLIGGMYSSESKSKILARIQEHGDMTTKIVK